MLRYETPADSPRALPLASCGSRVGAIIFILPKHVIDVIRYRFRQCGVGVVGLGDPCAVVVMLEQVPELGEEDTLETK